MTRLSFDYLRYFEARRGCAVTCDLTILMTYRSAFRVLHTRSGSPNRFCTAMRIAHDCTRKEHFDLEHLEHLKGSYLGTLGTWV